MRISPDTDGTKLRGVTMGDKFAVNFCHDHSLAIHYRLLNCQTDKPHLPRMYKVLQTGGGPNGGTPAKQKHRFEKGFGGFPIPRMVFRPFSAVR